MNFHLSLYILLKQVCELHKISVPIEDCTESQIPATKASTMSFWSTT